MWFLVSRNIITYIHSVYLRLPLDPNTDFNSFERNRLLIDSPAAVVVVVVVVVVEVVVGSRDIITSVVSRVSAEPLDGPGISLISLISTSTSGVVLSIMSTSSTVPTFSDVKRLVKGLSLLLFIRLSVIYLRILFLYNL